MASSFINVILIHLMFSVNMDGSGLVELVSDIIVTPDGLAVDWVSSDKSRDLKTGL